MLIHLLRHAQFGDDGLDGHADYYDPTLDDVGRQQAAALGERLRDHFALEALYTSDLRRAQQTAEIVGRIVGLEPRGDARFREICRGECEFRPMEEIAEAYPDFYQAWTRRETDFRCPNGECGEDVWRRASEAVAGIAAQPYESVAVVTHGGLIMALLAGHSGAGQANRFRFKIALGSINTLAYDAAAERYRIVRVGDTAHLD